jgi:isoleucyl-tRNA synthetase
MAPFLSFTAEEAWKVFGSSESIFLEEYAEIGGPDSELLAKWRRIGEIRAVANKEIEALRAQGQVGSSLQAHLVITAGADDHALLAGLGDDLKFVFITSAVRLQTGNELAVQALPSPDPKCDRCWHWRPDVGVDAAHPAICGRCVSNLFGAGEPRVHA